MQRILAVLVVVIAGCTGATARAPRISRDAGRPPADADRPRDPDAISGDLPCGVERALAAGCQECHAGSPRYGAPMPLVTHDDLLAAAPTDPSLATWEMVARRLDDPARPMPPAGRTLAPEDRAALDAWIAAGAPAGEGCGRDPITPDGPDVEALPCTPTHRMLAHADGSETAPYPVRVTADRNLHTCFAFRSPFSAGTQATAWAPVIENERVLHHWIVWGSDSPPPGGAGVFPCETLPSGDAAFVMGWAPGGRGTVLPPDVGLALEHEWYFLQVHYYDATDATDVVDASGVAICTTPTPRANAAGVLAFGTVDIAIPPRARGHAETFTCPGWILENLVGDFTVLGSGPHMHRLGTSFRSEVLRGDGSTTPISVIDRWDFESQTGRTMDPPLRIRSGDEVRVTCTYDNPGATTVGFGENTDDEMCFDFMLVYPITRWPSGIPRFCAEPEGLGL